MLYGFRPNELNIIKKQIGIFFRNCEKKKTTTNIKVK